MDLRPTPLSEDNTDQVDNPIQPANEHVLITSKKKGPKTVWNSVKRLDKSFDDAFMSEGQLKRIGHYFIGALAFALHGQNIFTMRSLAKLVNNADPTDNMRGAFLSLLHKGYFVQKDAEKTDISYHTPLQIAGLPHDITEETYKTFLNQDVLLGMAGMSVSDYMRPFKAKGMQKPAKTPQDTGHKTEQRVDENISKFFQLELHQSDETGRSYSDLAMPFWQRLVLAGHWEQEHNDGYFSWKDLKKYRYDPVHLYNAVNKGYVVAHPDRSGVYKVEKRFTDNQDYVDRWIHHITDAHPVESRVSEQHNLKIKEWSQALYSLPAASMTLDSLLKKEGPSLFNAVATLGFAAQHDNQKKEDGAAYFELDNMNTGPVNRRGPYDALEKLVAVNYIQKVKIPKKQCPDDSASAVRYTITHCPVRDIKNNAGDITLEKIPVEQLEKQFALFVSELELGKSEFTEQRVASQLQFRKDQTLKGKNCHVPA